MKSEHLPSRSHTRELLDFLAALSLDRVPASTLASAKGCLLDTLGCMLFGAPEPWSVIMAAEMLAERSLGVSTIAGHSEQGAGASFTFTLPKRALARHSGMQNG